MFKKRGELADHERAHSGQPGAKVRHGADAVGAMKPFVIHHHPDYDEYKVGRGKASYYTNDKEDATNTARKHFGATDVTFRSRRYESDD